MDAKTEAAIKEFNGLVDGIKAAYITVIAVLAALPVPMLMAADGDGSTRSLSRAWEMTGEEPLLPVTVASVRSMITALITARQLAWIVSEYGYTPWNVRAIEDALTRISEAETVILRHLAGDFRAERLTDEAVADIARLYGNHTREVRQGKR